MNKQSKFKKALPNIILALVFLIGLSIFLYPYASDFINNMIHVNELKNYDAEVAKLSLDVYDKMFNEAFDFNKNLVGRTLRQNQEFLKTSNYENILSILGNKMIGYLKINKINVRLPIYHGTSDEVLQKGIGHYEGTSFPIGRENEHSVLVGHTGLPSAKLISDLAELKLGDRFDIVVLNKVLSYEVDQILVVEPTDSEPLEFFDENTYCTILTCTPYGINSHRLLVRGKLRDNSLSADIPSEARVVDSNIIVMAISIPLIISLFILMINLRKRSIKRKEQNEKLRKESK